MLEPHTHRGDGLGETDRGGYEILVVEGDESPGAVADGLASLDREFAVVETSVGPEDTDVGIPAVYDGIVCSHTLAARQRSAVLSVLSDRDLGCPVFVVCEDPQQYDSLLRDDTVTDFLPLGRLDNDPMLARRIKTHIDIYRTCRALDRADTTKLQILETIREALSPQEVGTAFCRLLVNACGAQTAWLRTTQGRGELTRQWAAGETSYVSDLLEAGTHSTEPAATAFRTGEAVTVAPIDGREGGWQQTATDHGFGSAVGVPIEYQGTVLGALSVYSDRTSVSARTRDFLSWLAQIVGCALRTAAWREAVLSATPIAVEIELTDRSVPLVGSLQGLPDETCLSVLSAIPHQETVLYVLQLRQGTPDEVMSGLERVSERVVVLTEQPPRFEALFARPTPESVLMAHGGQLVSASVSPATAVMTIAVRGEQRVNGLFDAFEAEYDGVSVGAVWSRGTEEPTGYGDIAEVLTVRQRQVLEFAYLNGYFQRPRQHNTTEIAKKLGLSRQTVSQHLRAAQQKLLRELLEPER